MSEMSADNVAKTLAAKFLENGNYEALGASLSDRSVREFASAAATRAIDQTFYEEDGFAGLSVQSVGWTRGAEEERVVIYVTKGSQRSLKQLPEDVDGIKVDARVMGRLRVTTRPAMASGYGSHFYLRGDRIACGSSVAPSGEDYAGTLGAFASGSQGRVAISNNHVFAACNHTPVGMPILSPASMDARPDRASPREVCRFKDMCELRSGVPALVPPGTLDAAIGSVNDQAMISSWQGDEADGYDTPATTIEPSAGMRVKKFGRTTGLTEGTIEAFLPTPWVLPYKSTRFNSQVWLQDSWTVRGDDGDPFALGGDSGSLIVTEDGQNAVGLLFAVNSRGLYGIFCPIDAVLAHFGGLTLLNRHEI